MSVNTQSTDAECFSLFRHRVETCFVIFQLLGSSPMPSILGNQLCCSRSSESHCRIMTLVDYPSSPTERSVQIKNCFPLVLYFYLISLPSGAFFCVSRLHNVETPDKILLSACLPNGDCSCLRREKYKDGLIKSFICSESKNLDARIAKESLAFICQFTRQGKMRKKMNTDTVSNYAANQEG